MCQILGAVADARFYLQPSATICNHLQPAFMGCLCWGRGVPSPSIWLPMLGTRRPLSRYMVAYVGDEASLLPVYGLQIIAYLQPYLQPCKMFDVNGLWRYFGLGCRWQMKMKTIFCSGGNVVWVQLRLNWSVIKA